MYTRQTASETIEQIASLLKENPAITRKEAAQALGRSYGYICQRWAAACKAAGTENVSVSQKGKGKGGRDLIGKRFGHLIVVSDAGIREHGKHFWRCRCDCGREVERPAVALTSGQATKCARWDHEILGQHYNSLTVLDFAGVDAHGAALYRCRCDCGREITAVGRDVSRGSTKSCGCSRNLDYVEGTKLSGLDPELRKDSTSGVTGVRTYRGRWLASIRLSGHIYYLGEYRDFEQAVAVRREAEKLLYDPMLTKYGHSPTDEKAWQEQVAKALEALKERYSDGPARSYYAIAKRETDEPMNYALHVFGGKKARDIWVAEHDPDGFTREAIRTTEIRGYGSLIVHNESDTT